MKRAAAAAVCLVLAASPARATPPEQAADALVLNAGDLVAATIAVALTNADNPDQPCDLPAVAGYGVPAARTTAGEVYGFDAAIAEATCMSADGRPIRGELVVYLQYQPPGGNFTEMLECGYAKVSGWSVNGVLHLVTPPVSCSYDVRSPYYRTMHRGYAVLTVDGRQYAAPSVLPWSGGV